MATVINIIRKHLKQHGPCGIKSIARVIDEDTSEVYGYLTNDILNERIVVNKTSRPHMYSLAPDIGDSLLVSDAVDLIEAIGGTIIW